MGSRPDGWWRDRAAAKQRLVALIGSLASAGDEQVIVVFDGHEPSGFSTPPGLDVRFSGERSADDVIADLAGEGPCTVVTSDAALAARVRAVGADVIGAGAFRDRIDARS